MHCHSVHQTPALATDAPTWLKSQCLKGHVCTHGQQFHSIHFCFVFFRDAFASARSCTSGHLVESKNHLKRTRKSDSIDAAQNAPPHHTNEKKMQEKDSMQK